jgi:hypothetical protein
MEKAIAKEIREDKWKEKEKKQAKWIAKLGSAANQSLKCGKKCARIEFIGT